MGLRNSSGPARTRVRSRSLLTAVLLGLAVLLAACSTNTPSPTTAPDEQTAGAPGRGLAVAPPTAAAWATPGVRTGVGGCPLFPPDHVFRATVTQLQVLPRSAQMIAATGPDLSLRGGFSSGIWQGSRSGIPFNVVDGNAVEREDFVVSFDYHDTKSEFGIPLPDNPRFEGWPGKAWDKHLVVVDTATCESRELINVRGPDDDLLGIGGGRWFADAAATVDLTSNDRPEGVATASQISLMAGLVRFDEVAAGRIDHAIASTLSEIKLDEHVWPALSTDGRSEHPDAIPMGSWLRLRDDVDLSGLGPQSRVVADALRIHGTIVMDTGPGFVLEGDPDPRWDDDDLDSLESLTLSDFELVDASPMMVSPESHQMRTR
jgi:hypothetical protein